MLPWEAGGVPMAYLIDVTSQPRATADLHIREPRKPFPPQTTNFFAVAMLVVLMSSVVGVGIPLRALQK